jgi:cytochrome c oxidase cbb3-type subunit 3
MAQSEKDPITGQYTTGHVWNGIKELRTPVPGWWLTGWLACIAFALGYIYFHDSFPTADRVMAGAWGYSARDNLADAVADARSRQVDYLERVRTTPLDRFRDDPTLARFAFNGGRAAFAVNCIACHGVGAGGQIGQFPSLVDDDWLWGGGLGDIETTIRHGIRNGGEDARASAMPNFGEVLAPAEIQAVAAYVLALNPASPAFAAREKLQGAQPYQDNCAGCHGEDGAGNRDFGAPRLNDAIWLYGGRPEQIAAQIARPRMGVMPAFGRRLSDEVVKMLAFYVGSLGGAELEKP